MSEVLEGWVAVHDPLPKRRLIVRPWFNARWNGLVHLAIKARFAAAIKHSCCVDVNSFQLCFFDVVEHDPVTNEVAILRHEYH